MNRLFFENIYAHPDIKKEEYNRIIEAHNRIEFSKGDIILSGGEMSNAYYLIESGLFRSFVVDYHGNEITTGFFGPNQVLIEVASLFLRTPSGENMQALSGGVFWKINYDLFQELYNSVNGFTEWGRSWMSNELVLSKQRSINMLTQSATERYLKLIEEHPEIIQQAPLKYIASYLGVTDTSLSRIRKEISGGT